MGKEDKVEDDNQVTDDKIIDGVPASVAAAIDKANEDNAEDDDDQYEKVDDDKGDSDKEASDAGDDDSDEGDDDTDDDDDTDGDDDDTEDGDDLTADQVEGLKVLGYDEEMVRKLNDVDPNIVKDILSLLESGDVEESSEEDSEPAPKKAEKVETKGLISDEDLAVLEKDNPHLASIVKGLSATVGQLTESLNTVAEADEKRAGEAKNRENYDNFCDTNKRLDDMAKDHPVFGKYDDLPMNGDGVPDERNRSVKARAKVFGQAQALYSTGSFGTFKECLDSAVTLYEGKNGEKSAMRKVSKELRGRAKQITSRPNRNKHQKKQPKPGTDAHMEKIVGDAFKTAGVEA